MRRLFVPFIPILLLAACSKGGGPTGPSSIPTKEVTYPLPGPPSYRSPSEPWVQEVPLHHNIPTSLPDGTVGWMCETKVRHYVTPDGKSEYLLDHYVILGDAGCPDIPID